MGRVVGDMYFVPKGHHLDNKAPNGEQCTKHAEGALSQAESDDAGGGSGTVENNGTGARRSLQGAGTAPDLDWTCALGRSKEAK